MATWLFQNSGGSVLPSVVLHLTANLSLNHFDAPIIHFGALLAIVAVAVVIGTRGTLAGRRARTMGALAERTS